MVFESATYKFLYLGQLWIYRQFRRLGGDNGCAQAQGRDILRKAEPNVGQWDGDYVTVGCCLAAHLAAEELWITPTIPDQLLYRANKLARAQLRRR